MGVTACRRKYCSGYKHWLRVIWAAYELFSVESGIAFMYHFRDVMYSRYNIKIGCLSIGGNAKLKCQIPFIIDFISKHVLSVGIESKCVWYIDLLSIQSSNGVSKTSSFSDDILWPKLDRWFFGLANDLVCVACVSPESSPYAQDVDLLQECQTRYRG